MIGSEPGLSGVNAESNYKASENNGYFELNIMSTSPLQMSVTSWRTNPPP